MEFSSDRTGNSAIAVLFLNSTTTERMLVAADIIKAQNAPCALRFEPRQAPINSRRV